MSSEQQVTYFSLVQGLVRITWSLLTNGACFGLMWKLKQPEEPQTQEHINSTQIGLSSH